MRRLLYMYMMIGILGISASAVVQAHGTEWHIEPTGLGPIRIGMPIDQALQSVAAAAFSVKATSKMSEGTKSSVYEVSQGNKLLFTIEPDKKTVWRIDVRAPEFQIDGVGVGTTLIQLKQRFPAARFHSAAGGEMCGMMMREPVGYAFCFKNLNPAPTSTIDHVRIFSTTN